MPGIVGFTEKRGKLGSRDLSRMRDLLKYSGDYVDEGVYHDRAVYCSRTHLGSPCGEPYVHDERIYTWLEGEFYNRDELGFLSECDSEMDGEFLGAVYGVTGSFDFLRKVDGYYSAVVYDKERQSIHLISDRHGFKPLYFGLVGGNFVWASELKGFLAYSDFEARVDSDAVKTFFDHEYLVGNRTWFHGIELVPPGSVLSYQIRTSKIEKTRYWSWDEIGSKLCIKDEREYVEEFGRRFRRAVNRCVKGDQRIGLLLSGGLDSRAILAALPKHAKPVHSFTFGKKGAPDTWIARRVSQIGGTNHHFLELNSKNWLGPRIDGIWRSDGGLSLLDMHGVEFSNVYREYADVLLNGFWGGPSIGGWYVTFRPEMSEEYLAENYTRRHINAAILLGETWIPSRRPFASNEMVEFAFSIPREMRQNSYIFIKMLVSVFPEYFSRWIPWRSSGFAKNRHAIAKAVTMGYSVLGKVARRLHRVGFPLMFSSEYYDYRNWIRQEPARCFVETVLMNRKGLYRNFNDLEQIESYWKEHVAGAQNREKELGLALTFEVWLQQVFEGAYRKGLEHGT